MIRAEDVADIQPGDVVELSRPDVPGVRASAPAVEVSPGRLYVGIFLVRWENGDVPASVRGFDLTVVSRAPRPLYVNHPRTEPVPGDVVRDEDRADSVVSWSWAVGSLGNPGWRYTGSANHWCPSSSMPARLRLLVDGETGMPVGQEPAEVSWCPSAEHHRRMVRSAHAEGWAEGFEAAAEWAAHNPGPGGIPHDPPSNPYETGQVVP